MSIEIELAKWADDNPAGSFKLGLGDVLRYQGYEEQFWMELFAPDQLEWGLGVAEQLRAQLRDQLGIVTNLVNNPLVTEFSPGPGTRYLLHTVELEIVGLPEGAESVTLTADPDGIVWGESSAEGGGDSGGGAPLVIIVVALAFVAVAGIVFATVFVISRNPSLAGLAADTGDAAKLIGGALLLIALGVAVVLVTEGSAGAAKLPVGAG